MHEGRSQYRGKMGAAGRRQRPEQKPSKGLEQLAAKEPQVGHGTQEGPAGNLVARKRAGVGKFGKRKAGISGTECVAGQQVLATQLLMLPSAT